MMKLVIIAQLVGLLFACSSNEEHARTLYNQALTAEREGHAEQAEALLKKVIADYPQTKVATEANEALNKRKALGDFVSGVTKALEGSTQAENEQAAIIRVRTINTASITFLAEHGGRYPRSLKELVDAGLLDRRFNGDIGGYRFTWQAQSSTQYEVYAEPLATKNGRYFYSNTTAVIRYEHGHRAGPSSPSVE